MLRTKDAIVAVNGTPVDGSDSTIARVRVTTPGTRVTLTVVRGGRQIEVVVTAAVRPASSGG